MFFDNDDDHDSIHSDSDISLTSSVHSENDADQVYLVEDIIAEKIDPDTGKTVYLVRWEGYPLDRATWEPIESFDDESMIDAWHEKEKERIARGEPPFDWEAWDEADQKAKEEQMVRRLKRERKRKRLGWKAKSRRGSRQSSKTPSVKSVKSSQFVVPDDYISEDDDGLPDSGGSDSDQPKKPKRRLSREVRPKPKHRAPELPMGKTANPKKDSAIKVYNNPKALPSYKIPKKRRQSKSPEPGKPQARKGTAHRTAVRSGYFGNYTNLSTQNRLQKRSRQEPPPDPNALQLFHPSNVPRNDFVQTTQLAPVNQPYRAPPSGPQAQAQAQARPTQFEDSSLGQFSSLSLGRPSFSNKRDRENSPPLIPRDLIRDISPPNASPPYKRHASDATWGTGFSYELPPTPTGDVTMGERGLILECDMEYGPAASTSETIRNVKLIGFSTEFMGMFERREIKKLWVSKSLENSYISKILVPQLGQPLEFADVDVSHDECQSLVSALAILHGAGVVLDESFTLLIFQPTNDVLRQSLKPPQQRRKTPLRAVAYPPLEVDPTVINRNEMRPPFDEGFRYYLPNLMFRVLGMQHQELFKTEKDRNQAFFVVYAPSVARKEKVELENALRYCGHKPMKIDGLLSLPSEMRKMRIFIHQSLKYQLHILPHIAIARKIQFASFFFFGMSLERGDETGPLLKVDSRRFWGFGSLILLTPEFVLNNEKELAGIIKYQKQKAGSTTLCITSSLVSRMESWATKSVPENSDSISISKEKLNIINNTMNLVYSLQERIKTGAIDVVELPVDVDPQFNEFETVADAFVEYQAEKADQYRRFIVAHSKDENVASVRAGLYACIDFHDPESLKNEILNPPKPSR